MTIYLLKELSKQLTEVWECMNTIAETLRDIYEELDTINEQLHNIEYNTGRRYHN